MDTIVVFTPESPGRDRIGRRDADRWTPAAHGPTAASPAIASADATLIDGHVSLEPEEPHPGQIASADATLIDGHKSPAMTGGAETAIASADATLIDGH